MTENEARDEAMTLAKVAGRIAGQNVIDGPAPVATDAVIATWLGIRGWRLHLTVAESSAWIADHHSEIASEYRRGYRIGTERRRGFRQPGAMRFVREGD